MEEKKRHYTAVNAKYLRIIPGIGYYLKSKNIAAIWKCKYPLFAAVGEFERIYLFSNSLELMSTLCGVEYSILCLCALPNKILANGSDESIKIWDIKKRSLISTLSGHTEIVSALCNVKEGVFVSGSWDKSLIIWSKESESYIYSHRETLTGSQSPIRAIIRISKTEIMSGESYRDLRIWDIDQGICTRHIPNGGYNSLEMKLHMGGDVVVSHNNQLKVWGAANNWETTLKQFTVCYGHSIEFSGDDDLLLRGGAFGDLEFIDYRETGSQLPPPIKQLHSNVIIAIQRIVKNILLTASVDGYLKVIHLISRKCYLCFKTGSKGMRAIAYFY